MRSSIILCKYGWNNAISLADITERWLEWHIWMHFNNRIYIALEYSVAEWKSDSSVVTHPPLYLYSNTKYTNWKSYHWSRINLLNRYQLRIHIHTAMHFVNINSYRIVSYSITYKLHYVGFRIRHSQNTTRAQILL